MRPLGNCWSPITHAFHCMTTSRPAAATDERDSKPSHVPQGVHIMNTIFVEWMIYWLGGLRLYHLLADASSSLGILLCSKSKTGFVMYKFCPIPLIICASFNFLIFLFINNGKEAWALVLGFFMFLSAVSPQQPFSWSIKACLSTYSSLYFRFQKPKFLLRMCPIHALFLFEITQTRHCFSSTSAALHHSWFFHQRRVFHLSQGPCLKRFQHS